VAKKKPDLDALGAQYREAKDALPVHRKRWADAERAYVDWLNTHRHVPSSRYLDPETGEPTDPELIALLAAMEKAASDDVWVRCLVLACGEAYKGEPLEKILARQGQRPTMTAALASKGA
jgi:hypothetical protein